MGGSGDARPTTRDGHPLARRSWAEHRCAKAAGRLADAKNYPLFQQAYQELGYPGGYFNDRLVDAIDNALATPDVGGAVALTQPKVLYEYADPALQSLSAGQKALLRMGPDNAAKVKAKLRELRRIIAAQRP